MVDYMDQFEFEPDRPIVQASPEGKLSGDGVAVLRFPECLLDGLLAAAPGPLACPSHGTRPPSPS